MGGKRNVSGVAEQGSNESHNLSFHLFSPEKSLRPRGPVSAVWPMGMLWAAAAGYQNPRGRDVPAWTPVVARGAGVSRVLPSPRPC